LGREYVTHGLDDAWDKLRWARHHFENLRPEIEAFEERDSHTISVDIHADVGEYVFYVHGLEIPDEDWGLVIGDCLHNARTALDYLMVRLAALVTGKEPRDTGNVQFPIYSDPKRFAGAVGELRKHPAFSGYLARIEELQPFNNGNPSIWGTGEFGLPVFHGVPALLDRLSVLDNIDKHRVVHAAWLGTAWHRSPGLQLPAEFKSLGGTTTGGPLEDGAEIGRQQFEVPLPFEWHPDEMDMKRCFPIEVAIDQPLPMKGVLEVLPLCLWSVEAVLNLFRPVFEEPRRPPPPVTTMPWPS
jgi:hypothetical protein